MVKRLTAALLILVAASANAGLWIDGQERVASSESIETNSTPGTNVVSAWTGGLLYYFPFETNAHKDVDYSSNRMVASVANYRWTNSNPAGPVQGYGVTNAGSSTFQLFTTSTQFGTQFTIAMWIRSQNHSFPVRLYQLRTNNAGTWNPSIDYFIGAPGGNTNAKPTLQISNGGAIEPDTNMVDNVFHHHAIVFTADVWRLYIDGVQLGIMTQAWVSVAGSTNEFGDQAPSFDEITAWNRSLASNEIVALYNGGAGTSLWVSTITSITTNSGTGSSGPSINGSVPLSTQKGTFNNGARAP